MSQAGRQAWAGSLSVAFVQEEQHSARGPGAACSFHREDQACCRFEWRCVRMIEKADAGRSCVGTTATNFNDRCVNILDSCTRTICIAAGNPI